MSRAPERRRRGRSQTERRSQRRDDERRWVQRKQAATVLAPARAEPDKSDGSEPADGAPAEQPMDIIERHREHHPTKVRTITGKRPRS